MKLFRNMKHRTIIGIIGLSVLLSLSVSVEASFNIAFNPLGTGLPSPLESDPGWGGGSWPWQMVDGVTSPVTWMHGLAFTGGAGGYEQPAGWRQATINFGEPMEFDEVVIWHPRVGDVPLAPSLDYWDGATWAPIDYTRSYVAGGLGRQIPG